MRAQRHDHSPANETFHYITCDDGIRNGDEVGVDCEGSCVDNICPWCNDTIKNGDEEAVDCGGSCSLCLTCYDGSLRQRVRRASTASSTATKKDLSFRDTSLYGTAPIPDCGGSCDFPCHCFRHDAPDWPRRARDCGGHACPALVETAFRTWGRKASTVAECATPRASSRIA